jgi:hypothetical protein
VNTFSPRRSRDWKNAILAQLVEQLICNLQVVGSSPTNGSFFINELQKLDPPVSVRFTILLLF